MCVRACVCVPACVRAYMQVPGRGRLSLFVTKGLSSRACLRVSLSLEQNSSEKKGTVFTLALSSRQPASTRGDKRGDETEADCVARCSSNTKPLFVLTVIETRAGYPPLGAIVAKAACWTCCRQLPDMRDSSVLRWGAFAVSSGYP